MTLTYSDPDLRYSDPAFNYDGTREPSSGAAPHEPRLPFTYRRVLLGRGEASFEIYAEGRPLLLIEGAPLALALADGGRGRFRFAVGCAQRVRLQGFASVTVAASPGRCEMSGGGSARGALNASRGAVELVLRKMTDEERRADDAAALVLLDL